MRVSDERCSLCDRSSGRLFAVRRFHGERVCDACANAIARLLLTSEPAALRRIWSFAEPVASPHEREAAPALDHGLDSDDPGIMTDLAIAYAEMGLVWDSLESAARALSLGPNENALQVILSARVAPDDVLERLRVTLGLRARG